MDVLAVSVAGCIAGIVFGFASSGARQAGVPWIPITVGLVGGIFGGMLFGPFVRFMTKAPALAMGGVNGFDIVFAIFLAFVLLWVAQRASSR